MGRSIAISGGFVAAIVATATVPGCGGGGDRDDPTAVTTFTSISVGGTADDGTGADTSAPGSTGGGGKLDLGGGSSGSPMADDTSSECAGLSVPSEVELQPADIIFIVDNSGSMQFEASSVQQNMNAFSSQIFLANLDVRVVLLSSYPDDGEGICIDQPLGSGGCPTTDDNPPGFTHVPMSKIDSNNPLDRLIELWPTFMDVMRPEAAKHVVVVSDDNSDMNAATFTQMFTALDPANVGFTFHGIVADADPVTSCFNSNPCCAISAAPGVVYLNLIQQTGGVFGNLCEQQFQPIFDQLAMEVIAGATIACAFDIPPPPEGEEFDPDKVNVAFDSAVGTLDIGRVDDPADCPNVVDGWYYDDPDNPTQVVLCDQTCTKIQGFQDASVSVTFGCATVDAPPVG